LIRRRKGFFEGEDITKLAALNCGSGAVVPNDFSGPYGSLNPRMTVEQIIGEALDIHHLVESSEARRLRIIELLQDVGLNSAHIQRYPHEFSADSASGSASPAPWLSSRK